jgi:hypothetical protein
MNTKRKAELQRKLTLAPVPRPPAGLAQKIKEEIPQSFLTDTQAERQRFSRSLGFNLGVAASVLLMISSVFLILQLLSPTSTETPKSVPYARAVERKTIPLNEAPAVAAPPATVSNNRAGEESSSMVQIPAQPPASGEFAPERQGRLRSADAGHSEAPRDEPAFPTAPPQPVRTAAAADDFKLRDAVAAPAARPQATPLLAEAVQEVSPTASAPVVIPAPAAAPPPSAASSLVFSSSQAGAQGGMAASRKVAESSKDNSVKARPQFGIVVDPDVFAQIKSAIQQGDRPTAEQIDVDALVNYFAGPPRRHDREIRLEAELSPVAGSADPQRRLMRFTIDTPSTAIRAPEIITNATISVDFDPEGVQSHVRLGQSQFTSVSQSLVRDDASITALFDIDLQPRVRAMQRIVVVRLTYQTQGDERVRTIERVLYARDAAKSWSAASRRHRLASLGAMWAETLKNNAGGAEVAQRASDLAKQEPKDRRAQELATAASASSRLQSSGQTGSGR